MDKRILGSADRRFRFGGAPVVVACHIKPAWLDEPLAAPRAETFVFPGSLGLMPVVARRLR